MKRADTKTEVDKLIDWYKDNRPGFHTRIRVPVFRPTVVRFAHRKRPEYPALYYRRHRILPLEEWHPDPSLFRRPRIESTHKETL